MPWPAGLPQRLKIDGNTIRSQNGQGRTQMDRGPSNTRPLFSAVSIYVSGTMILTAAQYSTLETYFHTTLDEGGGQDTWVHPITGSAINFKFMEPPGYRVLSDDVIEASISIEILP